MNEAYQAEPSEMSETELLRELIRNRAAIERNERKLAGFSGVALHASDARGPAIRCVIPEFLRD